MENQELKQLVDSSTASIQNHIQEILARSKKVILGVQLRKLNSEIRNLENKVSHLNTVLTGYCEFITNKEFSLVTFKEIISFTEGKHDIETTRTNIGFEFIAQKKGDKNNFDRKKIAVVRDYDFKDEQEKSLNALVDLITVLNPNERFDDLWDAGSNEFALTDDKRNKVLANATVYASEAQIQKAIASAVASIGLNLFLNIANEFYALVPNHQATLDPKELLNRMKLVRTDNKFAIDFKSIQGDEVFSSEDKPPVVVNIRAANNFIQ